MSALAVTPIHRDVYVAVKSLLVTVTGFDPSLVLQGLPNRDSMPPASPGFASMQLSRMHPLRTPEETWDEVGEPVVIAVELGTELRCEVDFYGASAGDQAAVLLTLMRNEAGCIALAPACQPLYADDPVMISLDDSEQQYELRWNMTAVLQYNPVTSVPMDFGTGATVELFNVDEAYPP